VRDWLVAGYELLVVDLELPDQEDRPGLAAALGCNAQGVVSWNLRDVPASTLDRFDVRHRTASSSHVADLTPARVAHVLLGAGSRPGCSAGSREELMHLLRRDGPTTAMAALEGDRDGGGVATVPTPPAGPQRARTPRWYAGRCQRRVAADGRLRDLARPVVAQQDREPARVLYGITQVLDVRSITDSPDSGASVRIRDAAHRPPVDGDVIPQRARQRNRGSLGAVEGGPSTTPRGWLGATR
jgi:hypothetical protein